MREEVVRSDITVVGGGLAGVCAAVAAARLGQTVALINNRPVLGGNSSSEVRVWVCGATAHGTNRYARETGIMGELFTENQYRNPEGNPYFWDLTILETVRAEPNISLFLNTDVHEVEADGDADNRVIRSVTGWMMGSERRIRFESSMFLDCSGDGLVGFLAGAKYRIGREAFSEYGEDWAPEVSDSITLGSTLLFYTKDTGKPVKYVPPTFAKDITQTNIPLRRVIRSGDNGCAYWWIEWGGELDIVDQNERIRDELWSVIYGIWDYIKNSGQFDADNMTLEWIGSVPGKREYRRFVGDYVMKQQDIIAQEPFHDRIGFGGWSIDLHPPQGVYSEESGSKHLHADGVYHIPYRSLYSANVSNLLFAGRNVSASHVAFGTLRVMATCAIMGEAAGTGAALASFMGITPREVGERHLADLQRTMLRQDASIIGLALDDPEDLARSAEVRASSTLAYPVLEKPGAEAHPLTHDTGLLFPVGSCGLGKLELLADVKADTVLRVELWDTGKPENYVPAGLVGEVSVEAAAGEGQWLALPLSWKPEHLQNAFVVIRANDAVSLRHADGTLTGVLTFLKGDKPRVSSAMEDHQPDQPVVQWSMRQLVRKAFCFRALPMGTAEGVGAGEAAAAVSPYAPASVTDGYLRPYGGPHSWVSAPLAEEGEAWLELVWPEPVRFNEIQVIFNDDVNEDLINLHHHFTPFPVIPELARAYRLEVPAPEGDGWVVLAEEAGNRKRNRVHRLAAEAKTSRLRLTVAGTNGGEYAEVVHIGVRV
ncbi:FAD-dependent oxidoreductase [Paenibacillus mesotrionivorans]|uniref:FAD-dependent oxidoreductase n=1 Tax=Paenibacillus mesotrionivorans TaxID=3160968 RepID=A0ACC7NTR9_9BACL